MWSNLHYVTPYFCDMRFSGRGQEAMEELVGCIHEGEEGDEGEEREKWGTGREAKKNMEAHGRNVLPGRVCWCS